MAEVQVGQVGQHTQPSYVCQSVSLEVQGGDGGGNVREDEGGFPSQGVDLVVGKTQVSEDRKGPGDMHASWFRVSEGKAGKAVRIQVESDKVGGKRTDCITSLGHAEEVVFEAELHQVLEVGQAVPGSEMIRIRPKNLSGMRRGGAGLWPDLE